MEYRLQTIQQLVKKGIFKNIFNILSNKPDLEYAAIDGTISKVHRHGQGAVGGTRNQAIGHSRGGVTTKIMALVDALGNLVKFVLLPGNKHDIAGVLALIENTDIQALLADKAFDADWLFQELDGRGVKAVIAQKSNRKNPTEKIQPKKSKNIG